MNFDAYDTVIVGCGLSGSVVARELADEGFKVLILEKRNHIGGNMYDYLEKNGVRTHLYGPHVFHTNSDTLMEYMSKYADWQEFRINCKVHMNGKTTPSPFNFKTIDDYYDRDYANKLKKALTEEYPDTEKITVIKLLKSDNPLIKQYAEFLFENDYRPYTSKQWGIDPDLIDCSVLERVPIILSYTDGYFTDKYQCLPKQGYINFFKNILDNPNIDIITGFDSGTIFKIANNKIYYQNIEWTKPFIYTGELDYLFGYEYGKLPYRSLRFEMIQYDHSKHLEAPIVAYPQVKDITRITDYSYFYPNNSKKTTIALEYPTEYIGDALPYYPILTDNSIKQYDNYAKKAYAINNLFIVGRLGKFKYYNMDQALENALRSASEILQYLRNNHD